jgi:tRNA (guanine10-N2)-dimethyltransferase
MKLLFELSGEHPTLPEAEAKACLRTIGIRPLHDEKRHVLVMDAKASADDVRTVGNRLALSHAIYEVLSYGSIEDIEQSVPSLDFEGARTFSIQGRRFGATPRISVLKQRLGDCIRQETKMRVDLAAPDVVLVIIADAQVYLCRRLVAVNRSQFEQRKSQHRPFASPISLHPRTARALVNLSGISSGQTLMDPFCGTGGLLIEAGIIGAQIVGIDVMKTMVEGCQANLAHYGIAPADLRWGDATTMEDISPVDAIATDLPYGRSTHVTTSLTILYQKTLNKMKDWLKPTGTAVVGLPGKRFVTLAKQCCSVEAVHPMRVHRSLTRYFCVLRPV